MSGKKKKSKLERWMEKVKKKKRDLLMDPTVMQVEKCQTEKSK